MRSKAPLLMMEQLVMVLVFALAAALCLRCFVLADEISEQTVRQDEAVLIAQNTAELLKAGVWNEDEAMDREYKVQVREIADEIAGLRRAEIAVCFENEILFQLTIGWAEELE